MKTSSIPKLDGLLDSLSPSIKEKLKQMPSYIWDSIQEIRLQAGKVPYVILPGRVAALDELEVYSQKVSKNEIEQSFAAMCEYSVHTYLPQIQNGFITIKGGHRIGLGGTAVIQNGKLSSLRDITSLNIRLAREDCTNTDALAEELFADGLCSVLLAGEPSSGKTTMLRSLAILLSKRYRVTVVDERGEIMNSTESAGCLDVLKGFPKAIGVLQAVRTLSPQVIVCDELGNGDETEELIQAINCGVRIISSIHAGSREELLLRPQFERLQQARAFEKVVFLCGSDRPSQVNGICNCDELY